MKLFNNDYLHPRSTPDPGEPIDFSKYAEPRELTLKSGWKESLKKAIDECVERICKVIDEEVYLESKDEQKRMSRSNILMDFDRELSRISDYERRRNFEVKNQESLKREYEEALKKLDENKNTE